MLAAGLLMCACAQTALGSHTPAVDLAIPSQGAALGLALPTIAAPPLRVTDMVNGSPASTVQSRGLVFPVSFVPEPATLIAGAILLIPFAASTWSTLRKQR
jgi:hypothetical protein